MSNFSNPFCLLPLVESSRSRSKCLTETISNGPSKQLHCDRMGFWAQSSKKPRPGQSRRMGLRVSQKVADAVLEKPFKKNLINAKFNFTKLPPMKREPSSLNAETGLSKENASIKNPATNLKSRNFDFGINKDEKVTFKKKYKLIDVLGHGSNSTVYLCRERKTRVRFAVKIVEQKSLKSKRTLENLKVAHLLIHLNERTKSSVSSKPRACRKRPPCGRCFGRRATSTSS